MNSNSGFSLRTFLYKPFALLFFCILLLSACAEPGNGVPLGELVSAEVFAGDLTRGYLNRRGTMARFYSLGGIAVSPDGNIYVADSKSHRIRKITPSGEVTAFAGSGTVGNIDGQGTAAQFNDPKGIAFGPDGNLYVADNNGIRKITPSGAVTTEGSSAPPLRIAITSKGIIYATQGHRIHEIKPPSTAMAVLAGSGTVGNMDGQGAAAQFNGPKGIAFGPDGNIYVADSSNHRIRKVTPSGAVTTFVGSSKGHADGQGVAAQFSEPTGVALDSYGNLFVTDKGNRSIRRVSPAGKVSTILEDLYSPEDIAISPDSSTAYVTEGNRILRLRFR